MGYTADVMNESPENPSIRKPLTKKDYKSYSIMLNELRTDISIVDHALQRIGRNLKAIKDKRLYFCGGYATFQDFSEKELGQSRQQTYRLIAAFDIMQDLLVQGVPQEELPQSERLCREIRLLPAEKQAKVWKAVLRIAKEAHRPPTIVDVQAEAVKEENAPEKVQRQQKELLAKFEGVAKMLKISVTFDLLEPSFRLKLGGVLTEIAETVNLLIRTLKNTAIQERSDSTN